MSEVEISAAEVEEVACAALVVHGASVGNARPVAQALARAEAEGNRVCGLFYLPHFCAQLQSGKIDGNAVPVVSARKAVIQVDAKAGFAHPAVEAGLPALGQSASDFGVAAMSIAHSYNALALSHLVTPLADAGLIGVAMSNAPASVAPPGAKRKLFGTNPIAYAVPVPGQRPIVVDQSMSAVTKTEVVMRKARGDDLPPGLAQDRNGEPTTDPAAALDGSLLPAGGQKGSNLVLLIEILCAALSGSHLSITASPFADTTGGHPGVGQFLLAIDPGHFSADWAGIVGELAEAILEAGLRLPGSALEPAERITLPAAQWDEIRALAAR